MSRGGFLDPFFTRGGPIEPLDRSPVLDEMLEARDHAIAEVYRVTNLNNLLPPEKPRTFIVERKRRRP